MSHHQQHHHEQPQPQPQPSRRHILQKTASLIAAVSSLVSLTTTTLSSPSIANAAYIDPKVDPPKITKKVFLDVEFDDNKNNNKETTTGGTIVIGLYGDVMPKAADNFAALCASNRYAGTTFYRVVSDFSIQGGAVGDASGKTGRSSLEPDGQGLEPDNYNIKHTQEGLVSMVRAMDGTVDSRFFINVNDNGGWGDDRYAVIGIVLEGFDLVKTIEQVPVQPPKNNPKVPVNIVKSGVL